METRAAVDRISELLDADQTATSNTSMRIPTALRDATTVAVAELGAAPSTTALAVRALRLAIEATLMQSVLNEHYECYPGSRPDLGDLALAAAELDGHPLAAEPDRIRQAAAEISRRHPDADAEDVLLWAEARGMPAE